MGGSDPLVIWLDDLPRFLPPAGELSQATISRLADRPGPVVIIGHYAHRAAGVASGCRRRADKRSAAGTRPRHLDQAGQHPERPHRAGPGRSSIPAGWLRSGRRSCGEKLAGAPEALRRYRDAATADPLRHILVQTCIDWARCGLVRPIPEPDLLALARDALAENRPGLRLGEGEMDEALRRACKPVAGEGQIALLRTHHLTGRSHGYEAFDYLVAADDGQSGEPARPVTENTWRRLLDRATDEDAFRVGVSSYLRRQYPSCGGSELPRR